VGKFVRRNRIPVAATVLLAVTLVAGAATTLWQARVAQRRFQQLRHLANAFLFDFHDSIATLPGSMKARSLVVTKGLEYLDALGQESRGDAELQAEIARAYSRLGDVQGNPLESNLGDSSGALKSYRRAVEILRQISPRTPQVKRDLISAYTKLGTIQRDMGSTTEGLGSYRRAVALASEILAVEPSRGVMKDLSVLHDYEGRTLTTMGDIEGSLKATSESLALLNTLRAADPMNAEFIDSAATN
jgi:tetratricopeptide (TPR) repeat protein